MCVCRMLSNLPSSEDYAACQDRLDELLFCDCCEEHNRDKPTDYEPLLVNPDLLRFEPHANCDCDCLHEAHLICQNHPALVAAETLIMLANGGARKRCVGAPVSVPGCHCECVSGDVLGNDQGKV